MNREKISSGLLDPRSKLAVFIAACLSAFSGLTHLQEFVLLALCVGITLLCQKWKRAFYTGLIFAVMFLCDLFLTPRLSGILQNIIMLACHFCRFILPMFAAFYIVTQTIQEEWQMVNQALRLRGMALTWKNVLRRPMQMMEYMLVSFLLQCSVIVDEMSAAVMARGFDKNMPRTSYAEVQMKALDWCIIAVSAGLLFWNLCF